MYLEQRFKTDTRGYSMLLEQDLLGDYVLSRRWYGLHNRRGGVKCQVFLNQADALREFERVLRLRKRRGYKQAEIGIHR